jgi:hypothetical protein
MSVDNLLNDCAEIGRNQNIRERFDKSCEGSIVARRRRELFSSDLVWATLYRDGADL